MESNIKSELKKAREDLGLTIEEVSEKLNIRKKYLIALEEDDLSSIPGEVYIKGYLKMYANFLKIDAPNSATKINNTDKEEKQFDKANNFGAYLIIISLIMLLGVIVMYPLVI